MTINSKPIAPIRKTLATISGVLLVICLIPSIYFVAVEKVLLQPETYTQAFADQKLYQQLPKMLFTQLVSANSRSENLESVGQSLIRFPPDQLEMLIQMVFDKVQIESQITTFFNQAWQLITLQSDQSNLKFDLSVIKNELSGENGKILLHDFFKTLPPCSTADLAQALKYNPFDSESALPLCGLPDEILTLVLPFTQTMVQGAFSILPDQITVAEIGTDQQALIHIPASYIKLYGGFRSVLIVLPILCIVILAPIILLTLPDLTNILRFISVPLMTAGIISLVLTTIFYILLNSKILNDFHVLVSKLPADLIQALTEIIRQIGTSFTLTAGLAGSAIFIAGVIGWVASNWLPAHSEA